MANRYVTDGYVWSLRIVGIAAVAIVAWTVAENRDLEKQLEQKLHACIVNSIGGIDVCSDAPKAMPLLESPLHNYEPPPP